MRRIRHILTLSLLLATACSSSSGGGADTDTDGTTGVNPSDGPGDETNATGRSGSAGESDSNGEPGEFRPFRDDWSVVIDQPFATYAADGTPAITALLIGNQGGDNFRNRGDVIVQYVDTDRITVEMRAFTMADSEAIAQADFDRLSIRASTAALPPPPFEQDPLADCIDPNGQTPWMDVCQVAVFYDDLTQLDRSGADLRVTLPSDFIFDLVVVTEDNNADSDYQNRGNVCIENLPGSADVTLGSGQAWVILDPSTPEMPECPEALRTECEASGWEPATCGCLAQGFSFSQVRVTSNDGQASEATIDIPEDFWVGYNMRNDGPQTVGDDAPGAACETSVDDSTGTVQLAQNVDLDAAPWINQGSINYPGAPATEGAGFAIQLVSDRCAAILGTEDPADFVGSGQGPSQESKESGNLTICSGCARPQGCAALVPGL